MPLPSREKLLAKKIKKREKTKKKLAAKKQLKKKIPLESAALAVEKKDEEVTLVKDNQSADELADECKFFFLFCICKLKFNSLFFFLFSFFFY